MKIQPHYKSYATAWLLVLASATTSAVTLIGTMIVFMSSFAAVVPSSSDKCDSLCHVKPFGSLAIAIAVAAQFCNAGLKATRKLNYEADSYYSKAEYQLNTSKTKA